MRLLALLGKSAAPRQNGLRNCIKDLDAARRCNLASILAT